MFKSKIQRAARSCGGKQQRDTCFLLPSLFFFVTFVLHPMFLCIYTSFFDSTWAKTPWMSLSGWVTIKELFRDKLSPRRAENTVVIVVVAVPTVCAFSLWVATAIYDMKPALTSAFRCIFICRSSPARLR